MELDIPASHDKQPSWVRGVNKVQLLVDMLKECAWITADASLIYWLRSQALYLKSCCRTAIHFRFISVWILNSPPMESGILSLSSFIFWKWETYKGPHSFLGIFWTFAKQPWPRCLKRNANNLQTMSTRIHFLQRYKITCKACKLNQKFATRFFSSLTIAFTFVSSEWVMKKKNTEGYSNKRVLVQNRDGHFSQPAKC